MIAFSLCFVVTLPLAGTLVQRITPRTLLMIGMALMTAACLIFTLHGLYWLVAGLAVAGIGQGFAFNTSTTAAMDAVPAAKSGEASGVLNATRQLGSTLGIAVAGALFQTIESWGLLAAMQGHVALDSTQASLVRELFSGSSGGQVGRDGPRARASGRDRGRHIIRIRRLVSRCDAALRGRLAGGGDRGVQRAASSARCRALGPRQIEASSYGQGAGPSATVWTVPPPRYSGS